MSAESLDSHYRIVIKAMMEGRVVPLLGAGINLCGRPADVVWERQDPRFLPSGGELAGFLADYFEYPPDNVRDLVRVSQYAAVMQGLGPLYDELHEIFDADYEPSAIQGFLASLPEIQRDKGFKPQFQLIVTTNYDDALERAFRAAGEEFDVVSYVADGEHRGKFLHRPPEGEPRLIEKPNEYAELALDVRTVILKIHGAVDRVDSEWGDSYVITEDHYIDYLTRTDISGLLPVTLSAKLRRSHFLFLGYAMRDWNLRVILHRIWGQQKLNYKSWAIQVEPEPVEREFWQKRGVDILDVPLERYVEGLVAGLRQPLGAGVGT
jgi:SIR2-like domain